ncbi:MAG: hypothetical protein ACTHMF_10620 [Leifsonia sp.]|uniref:hypothetical protein n=1 Tax=Leifsonia sp. TaxID=1870902 RepID=UPI003F7F9E7B
MISGTVRRRATAALMGAAVLALLTGCDLFAPQDTKDIQETSDGVSGAVGQVFVGNAVLLTLQSGTPTNLVASLVNNGDTTENVDISTSAGKESVTLKPSEVVQIGSSDSGGGQTVQFEDLGAKPGSLADVTFDTGTETLTLQVPVLDGALEQYKDLAP